MMNLKILQDRIGYTFDRADLLQQAMTHRSYSSQHNERLEFLGDSLLNCVTAINLYERYAGLNEGTLSRLRSSLVRQQALYEIAQHLELSRFLRLGEGEIKAGGARRPSILADAMEALFGAVFLDSGFDTVRQVITTLFAGMMSELDPETYGQDCQDTIAGIFAGTPDGIAGISCGRHTRCCAQSGIRCGMCDRQIRYPRGRDGKQPSCRRTGCGQKSACRGDGCHEKSQDIVCR